MGSSTQKTNSTASGPGFKELSAQGPQRIEEQYQQSVSDPTNLVPQARGLVSSFMQPGFADPRNNPYFSGAMQDISGNAQQQAQSMFGRAGRGNSNNASGAGGYFADTFSRAAMPTLAQMYQQNQGAQLQAAGMSGPLDAASSLPLEQYLERMKGLSTLAQRGSTTSTQAPGQTIAGIGLTAAGLMTANPLLMAGGLGALKGGFGGEGGGGTLGGFKGA